MEPKSFWGLQEEAQTQTGRLLFVFGAVVFTTVAGTIAVARLALMFGLGSNRVPPFPHKLDIVLAAIPLLVIGIGALIKRAQLAAGGQVIAHMAGGRNILASNADESERRLLNIVEEMAIAAGIPVPLVFVLDREPGINAFAAGLRPADAVIAVSRGALDTLSRDELQGVVAHEFSHIFNGDMRMHMSLLEWVGGLQSISSIGEFMMNNGTRSVRRSSGKDGANATFLVLALGLLILGKFGSWMASIVKGAISRQREFLADATAVQYTRNPEGVGGALLKIMDSSHESVILAPTAGQISHFFFAPAVKEHFLSFSSHPPIIDRITRIAPGLLKIREERAGIGGLGKQDRSQLSPTATARSQKLVVAMSGLAPATIPATRSTHEAPAMVAALLCLYNADSDDSERRLQAALNGHGPTFAAEVARYRNQFLANPAESKCYAVLSLSMPAMRGLPIEERLRFLKLARTLVEANNKVTLLEAACLAVLSQALAPRAAGASAASADFILATSVILSAYFSDKSEFEKAAATLDVKGLRHLNQGALVGERLIVALASMRRQPPARREALLRAVNGGKSLAGQSKTDLQAALALAIDARF